MPIAELDGAKHLHHYHHAANAEMPELHDRMPVTLEPADWPAWLSPSLGDAASLLQPAPDGSLHAWPVYWISLRWRDRQPASAVG